MVLEQQFSVYDLWNDGGSLNLGAFCQTNFYCLFHCVDIFTNSQIKLLFCFSTNQSTGTTCHFIFCDHVMYLAVKEKMQGELKNVLNEAEQLFGTVLSSTQSLFLALCVEITPAEAGGHMPIWRSYQGVCMAGTLTLYCLSGPIQMYFICFLGQWRCYS